MATFEENIYQSLKRKGLASTFELAGVYGIYIDNHLVYIGKSRNILRRMAQHYVGMSLRKEHKYQVLAAARSSGHRIRFVVLYKAIAASETSDNEIGAKEGELIRLHRPPLNKQIPKAQDWHRYDLNPVADTIALEDIVK